MAGGGQCHTHNATIILCLLLVVDNHIVLYYVCACIQNKLPQHSASQHVTPHHTTTHQCKFVGKSNKSIHHKRNRNTYYNKCLHIHTHHPHGMHFLDGCKNECSAIHTYSLCQAGGGLCHTHYAQKTNCGWRRPMPHPHLPAARSTHSVQADPVLIQATPTSACCSRFEIPCSHSCPGGARHVSHPC